MSKTTILAKPTLASKATGEAALAFAEADGSTSTDSAAAKKRRSFFAPEGYRRLTVNLREDLHKKLRLTAVERDCTATEIIERLLVKELSN